MSSDTPRRPSGLRAPGRRLWDSIVKEYELDEHELALLVELARTVDALDLLDARVRAEGVTVTTPQGERAHPALVEARQQRIAAARLTAALRLPAGDDTDVRPQRRVGVRGVYGIRGSVKR